MYLITLVEKTGETFDYTSQNLKKVVLRDVYRTLERRVVASRDQIQPIIDAWYAARKDIYFRVEIIEAPTAPPEDDPIRVIYHTLQDGTAGEPIPVRVDIRPDGVRVSHRDYPAHLYTLTFVAANGLFVAGEEYDMQRPSPNSWYEEYRFTSSINDTIRWIERHRKP